MWLQLAGQIEVPQGEDLGKVRLIHPKTKCLLRDEDTISHEDLQAADWNVSYTYQLFVNMKNAAAIQALKTPR